MPCIHDACAFASRFGSLCALVHLASFKTKTSVARRIWSNFPPFTGYSEYRENEVDSGSIYLEFMFNRSWKHSRMKRINALMVTSIEGHSFGEVRVILRVINLHFLFGCRG